MSQSQPTQENRPVAAGRALGYLRFAVLVVVTLVVLTTWIALAARAQSLGWLVSGVMAIYFPPPFVLGAPDGRLIGVEVFLIVAAFLLCRRRYWSALATLVLPMAFTWVFAWKLLQG